MKRVLLPLCLFMAACGGGTASQPTIQTDVTAKPWVLTLKDTSSATVDAVTVSLQSAQCGSVAGPACFSAKTMQDAGGTVSGAPTSLVIGVPVNPVPNGAGGGYGMAFNFQYVYDNQGTPWTFNGTGQFYPNGNVAGSWQCDSSCGLSGNWTAGQQ